MNKDHVKKLNTAINKAQKIVIATHVVPDADGIGSAAALSLALAGMGKEVFCITDQALDPRYHYLDSDDVFVTPENCPDDCDLAIVLDTNRVERLGKKTRAQIEKAKNLLFIDHHPVKKPADNQLIDTTAAATGQLIGEYLLESNIKFTPEIALPIYTAIVIDTSSFRYPTVSARTHRLVAALLDTGIKVPKAYNEIYGTNNIRHIHLLGEILSNARISESGQIAWISITQALLDHYEPDIEDTHAFINHLLILEKVNVALMFRDDGDSVKISMRSHQYDVSAIATMFHGGGHVHSAATIIQKEGKTFEEIRKSVIAKTEEYISLNSSE